MKNENLYANLISLFVVIEIAILAVTFMPL